MYPVVAVLLLKGVTTWFARNSFLGWAHDISSDLVSYRVPTAKIHAV